MEVRAIASAATRRSNPLQANLDRLIFHVGTPEFGGALFDTARAATGCDHLTAFAVSCSGQPRMLFGENAGEVPVAQAAGRTYVSRFWHADPTNRLSGHRDVAGAGLLARATAEEIRNAPFRKDCYSGRNWSQDGARMIDRVSVFKQLGDETIKVSFHRTLGAGPFGDGEIEHIADATDVLIALVARQCRSLPPEPVSAAATPTADYASCIRAVHAVAPDLSDREAEICAGIVLGSTSEGIALDLRISINTVRTYRKRAYARLNISSQNELMKLVLPQLAKLGEPLPG